MHPRRDPFSVTPKSLSFLHVEDNRDDAELVRLALDTEWPGCHVSRIDTRAELVAALDEGKVDLILSDFSMPHFDGLTALELASAADVPFIFLSGTIGEDKAAQALQCGATDAILKDRPSRLIPAVRRALVEAHEHRRRRNAEARVQEQADFLNKAADAIIVSDLKRRIVYWNQGAERLFGWSGAEAMGRTEASLFGSSALREIDPMRRNATGEAWHGEISLPDKAGKLLVLDSRVSVIRGSGGEPKSHLIINTDITGRRRLEQQFLQAQRMESIGILAGGIAHDLNNVLAPMLMAVGIVQKQTADPEIRRLMSLLETSALRGASLIRQILAFARGADGERANLQLELLIREVTTLLAETLPRSISLEMELPHNLGLVSADATQLSQVFMNLCVNARDAMPAGGTLTTRGMNVMVGAAVARLHPGVKPGPYVLITVQDTGTGMPPEIVNRIFDPFFTTKGPGKGTGLGLSAVLGIVKGHGGFLEVKSEVTQGTTFSLYFPAVAPDLAPVRLDVAPDFAPRHGETILVIDDEPAIREILQAVLIFAGFKVLVADGGTAGIALFGEHRTEIKAVMVDLMMPDMQGREVIAALELIDPETRIIAMSGILEAANELKSKNGKLEFLAKPMSSHDVLTALEKVLPSNTPGLHAPQRLPSPAATLA
ncbi:MAG: hybrid sensor histidine kinase/response regulator [Verrucomicrobia bacterium]|nr:hybrid sensor histidine kinase/response regulator [Verrucomicrobiota bacterium]